LFDRKPVNPFAPIGILRAVARSVGQGRPQAGARALPLLEASTMARSRSVGGSSRVRSLIMTAIVLAMTGGSISAVSAASVKAQSAPMVTTNPVNPYAGYIAEASRWFGIPESWIRAVMRVESAGDVHALSPKGAMGLMQIMPETWAILQARYSLGANSYDPHDNILAGAAYLRELYDRYGAPGFLAAYNTGPARYEDHLASGRSLPAETRAYVAALAPMVAGEQVGDAMIVAVTTRSWTEAPLFVPRAENSPADSRPTSSLHSSRPLSDGAVEDLTALAPQSGGLFVRASHRNSKP
jgi:soluble lytic murein transglycosylase-like protein